jgi:hypothetical protein
VIRAVATIVCFVVALVALALVVTGVAYQADRLPVDWQPDPEIERQTVWYGIAAAGGLFLLAVGGAVVSGRAWRRAAGSGGVGHRTAARLESSRKVRTIVYGLLALVGTAVVAVAAAYQAEQLPAAWRPTTEIDSRTVWITMAMAGALALLLAAAAIVNGRWWRTARAIERLSGSSPDISPQSKPAAIVPTLSVEERSARSLPRVTHKSTITERSNLTGGPPLLIVYLRLFENQARVRTFLQGAWREFGYVHLLRGASSVSPREYRRAKRTGKLGDLLVHDRVALRSEINRMSGQVERRGFHKIVGVAASPVRVWDRHGSYPVSAVLCHGSFWQTALDLLLEGADLVVLDLSGLTSRNMGTRYELRRVIDRCPVERIVLLADGYSNRRFLRAWVQDAWHAMSEDSPNATPEPRTILLAVTDRFVVEQNQDGSSAQTRLMARRSETRRVAAEVERRAAPPARIPVRRP